MAWNHDSDELFVPCPEALLKVVNKQTKIEAT